MNDPKSLPAAVVWGMNICSSVGLIMANKTVLSIYAFKFATTLTAFHFLATAAVGLVSSALGFTTNRPIPFWTLFWFSLIADISIVSMNLSLMLNSVGFYQIAKLSIIPTCCFMEALLNAKTFSREVRISVLVVMAGVGVCTVTDVAVNLPGFVAAVVAVLSTTLQQVYIGTLQRKHNVGSFDLLSKTAPIQAVCLIVSGPLVDYILTGKSILEYKLSRGSVGAICISCFLALFVNMSTYLCIGKFSAVTFQVLGHMKSFLVLGLGWLLFQSVLSYKNLLGMAMAVVGMVLYSWAMEVNKARAGGELSQVSGREESKGKVSDDEEEPLKVGSKDRI